MRRFRVITDWVQAGVVHAVKACNYRGRRVSMAKKKKKKKKKKTDAVSRDGVSRGAAQRVDVA